MTIFRTFSGQPGFFNNLLIINKLSLGTPYLPFYLRILSLFLLQRIGKGAGCGPQGARIFLEPYYPACFLGVLGVLLKK